MWALPRGSIFAASGWGTYKARRGAGLARLSVLDDAGDLLGLAQVQLRRRGPARQVYIQGGPLLTDKGERHGEAVVRALLAHLGLGPLDLAVVDFARAESPGAVLGLLAAGFKPVATAGRHTLEVDLTRGSRRCWPRRTRGGASVCARPSATRRSPPASSTTRPSGSPPSTPSRACTRP
ncbi:hypothetical protein [Methylobacterium terrae]|uniref:hypothetical protein n=1 Tax=Methylobacterium terrae TaxID=2202827 RepID=UPI0031599887